MSLSAHEQQVLDAIEDRLAHSDPKLASLLGMFTRLTSGEQMPLREKIRAGWRRAAGRAPANRHHPRRGSARRRGRQLYRHMGWQRAMLLLWLLTAIALTAAALALSRGGGKGTCSPPWTISCTSNAPAHRPRPAAPEKALGQPQIGREFSLGIAIAG